jgi:hypothetical protein
MLTHAFGELGLATYLVLEERREVYLLRIELALSFSPRQQGDGNVANHRRPLACPDHPLTSVRKVVHRAADLRVLRVAAHVHLRIWPAAPGGGDLARQADAAGRLSAVFVPGPTRLTLGHRQSNPVALVPQPGIR